MSAAMDRANSGVRKVGMPENIWYKMTATEYESKKLLNVIATP